MLSIGKYSSVSAIDACAIAYLSCWLCFLQEWLTSHPQNLSPTKTYHASYRFLRYRRNFTVIESDRGGIRWSFVESSEWLSDDTCFKSRVETLCYACFRSELKLDWLPSYLSTISNTCSCYLNNKGEMINTGSDSVVSLGVSTYWYTTDNPLVKLQEQTWDSQLQRLLPYSHISTH